MKTTISNSDNVIDSRDVIARIEELEELATIEADRDEETEPAPAISEEEEEELKALQELASEAEDYSPDWAYGSTLIRDSYFKEYAMELADEIGAVPSDSAWPLYCIDWDRAVRDLQMDYTSVNFDCVIYWVR